MNLLITGAWTSKYIDEIEEEGHKVLFMQQEKDKLPCAYDWPEGIICNGLFLYHPLSRFTNLRYIQLTSAGLDRVPMQDILKRKIEIHSARGVYSVPMAEFAVAGVWICIKTWTAWTSKKHALIKNRQVRNRRQQGPHCRLWQRGHRVRQVQGLVAITGVDRPG